MLIGNGLLAKSFSSYQDNTDIMIFASGVSNSYSNNETEYRRERDLLKHAIDKYLNQTIVYFSSCDVINENMNTKMYYKHKLAMERMLKSSSGSYYIFRLPQVIGNSNNNKTLINFLYTSIEQERPFKLHIGTVKNIIDIQDVYKICCYIIDNKLYKNEIINIVNTQYINMKELILLIEKIIGKKAFYDEIEIISRCQYKNNIVNKIASKAGVIFNGNYLENVLRHYYLEKTSNV